MKKRMMKFRQIAGSFFAIMIILFSIGNSYIGLSHKISKPERQVAFSTTTNRITAHDCSGLRDDLPVSYQFLFTISGFSVVNVALPLVRITNSFHAIALFQRVKLSLAFINAP